MSTTTALERDFKQARLFARLILQDEPGEYRFIHPKTGKSESIWGTLESEEDFKTLAAYNARGFGVFAVVNRLDPSVEQRTTQGLAARDEDVTGVRALFVEMDRDEETPGENLRRLQEAPLRPSLIVRSSLPHKLHAYWLVDGIKPHEFEALQVTLIDLFGSDPTCKNLSRVMRVPGLYHTKREPLLTTIVEINGEEYAHD